MLEWPMTGCFASKGPVMQEMFTIPWPRHKKHTEESCLKNEFKFDAFSTHLYTIDDFFCTFSQCSILIRKYILFCHRLGEKLSFPNAPLNSWWRHQKETFSALRPFSVGNSQVTGEFPSQRPVTRSFDIFFALRLNKRLSKQWWGWWFETLLHPLWRHCDVVISLINTI